MIRQPTSPEARARWWRAALAGDKPPIIDGDVQCGLFKLSMDRGKNWQAVKITIESKIDANGELDQDEVFVATVNGTKTITIEIEELWLRVAKNPIGRNEYERLITEFASGFAFDKGDVY